tara:strand:- start:577 stop:786 length:210 start_codon:yes stop_codon:yes gene_type:complete
MQTNNIKNQGRSLSMYCITLQADGEPFEVWRLATDAEDAAWQANRLAVESQWKLIDVTEDDKEKTTLFP